MSTASKGVSHISLRGGIGGGRGVSGGGRVEEGAGRGGVLPPIFANTFAEGGSSLIFHADSTSVGDVLSTTSAAGTSSPAPVDGRRGEAGDEVGGNAGDKCSAAVAAVSQAIAAAAAAATAAVANEVAAQQHADAQVLAAAALPISGGSGAEGGRGGGAEGGDREGGE